MADDPFAKLESAQPSPQAPATPAPTQGQEPTISTSDPFSKYEPESQPQTIQDKYKKVMDSDSSRNAQVLGMSDKMGISPQAVEKNFDSVKKAYQAPTPGQVDNIINHDPALGAWGGDTKNLSAISDDLPAHGKFVDAMRTMMNYMPGSDSVALAEMALYKGTTGTLAHLGELSNIGIPENYDQKGQPIPHYITDFFQEQADFISSKEFNQDSWTESLKGNYAPMIAQVSAGLPSTGLAAGMFTLNPLVGGEYVFADTYLTSMQNSMNTAMPGSNANLAALTKASVAAGSMFIPMHYLSGIYKGLSPELGQQATSLILKRALINNLGGHTGMAAMGAVNVLADALVDKTSGANPHAMDNIQQKMADAGFKGALTFTVIGGIPTCIMAMKPRYAETKPPEHMALDLATRQRDNFLKAFDAAQARKLTTDNPDMAQKQTKEIGKSMGFTDVHIPLQEFQTLYQDNADEIAKQIGPETAKSYENAKAGFSAHVKAPMSELLNTKAPIQQEALADHIKIAPDLPTVTEAKITKEEADAQREKQKAEDEKTAENLEKDLTYQIQSLGGKAAEGATVIAKAKVYEFKNIAKMLGKPLSSLMQLAKISLMREPKEASFKETYDSTPGIATTKDFLERHGIKVLIEKPDQDALTGGALDEAKLKAASQKGDARNSEIPFAQDKATKGARSLQSIAQSLFDAANEGEIDKGHLPQEWWDEGQSGRPDFSSLDDLLELVKKGSGIESYQKTEQSNKEKENNYYQKGIDPTGLKPEDEKALFGNTKKPSEPPKQTLFQTNFSKEDYNRLLGRQRALEDLIATARDPKTGKTWTGDEHSDAFKKAEAEGVSRYGLETGFTKISTGEFMTREKAEKDFGFKKSSSLLEEKANIRDQVLHQGHRGRIEISGAAGEPQGREYKIFIEAGGDKSTINHEFAHLFLQIFRDHVTQEDSPQRAKDMEKQLFKMFDVKGWDEVNDRHSEMFARGWEWRLWEGKVPTAYTGIYNMFANWMRKIYPSTVTMEQYLNNVGVKMNDETRQDMRKIYDRFIASSEEIEASEKIMGYNKEAPEGLTEDELQQWKDGQDKATQAGIDTLITRKMGQLKKDAIEQIADERGRAQEKAEKEVAELPVFKASEAIKELIHEDNPKALAKKYLDQKTDDIETDALNHVAKELGYNSGIDLADALANSDMKAEIKERVDAHMEQFKERINSGPAEAQLATINEERKDSIAHEIAIMEQHKEGTPPKEEPKEDLATKSLQAISEAKGKMLGAEMDKAKAKPAVTSIKDAKPEMTKEEADLKRKVALQQYQRERAQAKVDAQRELAKLPIKDAMSVKSFVADVKEATKRVKEFQDKGNTDKAQEWRRRQLKSMEMADMAKKTALEVMKKRNEMRRFARIERKPLTMPRGHWLQIKSLLENSELKPPSPVQEKLHQQIANDMKDKEGADNDTIADATGYYFTKSGVIVPEGLDAFRERMMKTDPDLAGTLNIPEHLKMDNMTLRDFRAMTNAVKSIYKNGRDAENLDYSFGQIKKGIAVDQLKEALVNSTKDRGEFSKGFHKNIENRFWPVFAQVTRVANILDGGDKNGPFNRLIINPLLEGLAKRDGEKIDLLTRLQKVKQDHYPNGEDKGHNKLIAIKTSQGMQNFSLNEIKQIYAWMGRPEGMTSLTTGNKWSAQDLRTIIDHLDENDMKYMENVGKELSKDFPRLAKMSMDIDGVEPHQAETTPIETKHGVRDGFYYPLHYRKGAWEAMMGWGRNLKDDISKSFQDRVSKTSYTKFGITERNLMETTGVTGRALDTVNSPIARYVEDSARYLGLQPATKQVGKILNDKKMMEALKEHVGPGAAIFKDMVEYVAGSQTDQSTAIDKLFAVPRMLFFAHKIGFRPLLYPLKAGTDLGNTMFWPGEYGGLKAIASMKDHGYAFTFDMPDSKGATKQYGFKSSGMRELVDAVTAKDPMMKMSAINYDWNAREMMRQFNPNELNRWMQEKLFEKTGKNFQLPEGLHSAAAFLKMNVYMMERNADRQVRFPLWWHIYSEGRANGVEEKDAILAATKHVNDKLGSAEELYHVGPQRGNELFKQIAPVISFAANQFGQWYEHMYSNVTMKSKIGRSAFASSVLLSAASAAYYVYPATLKWMINELPQHDHKDEKKRFFRDLNDEAFQGIPVVGWMKHGLTTGNFDLPTLQFLADNTKAIHSLKDIGHMTEKDWQRELDAFTEDFPLPTSLETPTMNFIDHLHHPGGSFGLKDFVSKRKLPSEKKAHSFFK